MAFGVSAVYGGLAGSLLMINRPFASDVQFGLNLAIFLVVGLVAGGAGTISGAVPGALIYVFVPYFVAEWTLDQTGMPPGLKQATKPLFDWLENRQGGDAISGVFFGLGLLASFVQSGGIGHQLLSRDRGLMRDDPTRLTHSLNFFRRVGIAPVTMAQYIERLERNGMGNPNAKPILLGHCSARRVVQKVRERQ